MNVGKLEAQLAALEAALRAKLEMLLPGAAAEGWSLFTNSHFNSSGLNPAHLWNEAEECLSIAEQACSVADRIQATAPVARLYLDTCQACHNTSNPHRLGPRRAAQALRQALSQL